MDILILYLNNVRPLKSNSKDEKNLSWLIEITFTLMTLKKKLEPEK